MVGGPWEERMGGWDPGVARPQVLEVLAAVQAPPREVTERQLPSSWPVEPGSVL